MEGGGKLQEPNSQLNSPKDAAHILNVSLSALYKKLKSGALPSYRFGRKVLVDVDELRTAMQAPLKRASD